MKRISFYLLILSNFCELFGVSSPYIPLTVVIPSYNNNKYITDSQEKLYERNINSVLEQSYPDFKVIYIDDCSTDGTGQAVETFLQKNDVNNKVTLIRNLPRKGPLGNLWKATHMCPKDSLVIQLDGDDWLSQPDALMKINNFFQQNDIWVSWGQYKEFPGGKIGISRPLSQGVLKQGTYRVSKRWVTSAPRVFYAGLFHEIKLEDCLYKNKWIPAASDNAFMYPLIEMAGTRSKYNSEILYIRYMENPISNRFVMREIQRAIGKFLRNKKRYKRLHSMPLTPLKADGLVNIVVPEVLGQKSNLIDDLSHCFDGNFNIQTLDLNEFTFEKIANLDGEYILILNELPSERIILSEYIRQTNKTKALGCLLPSVLSDDVASGLFRVPIENGWLGLQIDTESLETLKGQNILFAKSRLQETAAKDEYILKHSCTDWVGKLLIYKADITSEIIQ